MTVVLRVDGLTVRFGGVVAVDNVSFDVAENELLGLIGPNGAGKTTIMRAITGVVTPQAGTISLAGEDITKLQIHQRVRRGLGFSQQLVRPFRSMTVVENVALAAGYAKTREPVAALFQMSRAAERERAQELLKVVGIADAADARTTDLPLGFLKRLEVARALALEPRMLLLDEPLAGLNHVEAGALADTIVSLNARGLTIILIEHNLSEVMRVCQRLVVVDNGRKLSEGAPREVMEQPAVRAAYLGEDAGDAAA